MALLKLNNQQGEIVADAFTNVCDAESIPAEGALLVSLEQWREHESTLQGRELGVRLLSDQHPESIAADLNNFAVIALDFPAFTDGRAYSYARVLRDNYGYTGEIRAVGDVLLEQLHYMSRVGFDAFEISDERGLADWNAANSDFSVFYERTNDGHQSIRELRKNA